MAASCRWLPLTLTLTFAVLMCCIVLTAYTNMGLILSGCKESGQILTADDEDTDDESEDDDDANSLGLDDLLKDLESGDLSAVKTALADASSLLTSQNFFRALDDFVGDSQEMQVDSVNPYSKVREGAGGGDSGGREGDNVQQGAVGEEQGVSAENNVGDADSEEEPLLDFEVRSL